MVFRLQRNYYFQIFKTRNRDILQNVIRRRVNKKKEVDTSKSGV